MKNLFCYCLLLLLFSCTEHGTSTSESNRADTILAQEKKAIPVIAPKAQAKYYNNFQEYWSVICQAVQVNDTAKVMQLIQVPLDLFGYEDQDPHYRINDSLACARLLFYFVETGYATNTPDSTKLMAPPDMGGLSAQHTMTYRQLFSSSLDTLDGYYNRHKGQEIYIDGPNGMEFFEVDNGGWKLITIYTDTRNMRVFEHKKHYTRIN